MLSRGAYEMKIDGIPGKQIGGQILDAAKEILTLDKEGQKIIPPVLPSGDLPNQPQLAAPAEDIRAIYLTGWSAGSGKKMNEVVDLIKRTELNGVVIDIKDYSGYLSYKTDIPEAEASGAHGEIRIAKPNTLIKKLHDENIYVIGRISVFQDTILAKAHPEWALKDKITGNLWEDQKGLAWMDPAAEPVWNYVESIAKDALARGFDEVNFDYIRFASDGLLGNIEYPFWQKTRTGADLTRTNAETKQEVIRNFFRHLREQLGGARMSADLFGLATVNKDDLGIGQAIEDAYKYFDYVSPMVYPSHYAGGFIGYKKPATAPYEVIKYSMDKAAERLVNYYDNNDNYGNNGSSSTVVSRGVSSGAKLRPWLQDFDLGADYTSEMVRKEILAVYDSLKNGTTTGAYAGWLLWDPRNVYTEGALEKAQ